MKRSARHNARRLAVQALYQWQYNHVPVTELESQFMVDDLTKNADIVYFKEILEGVLQQLQILDETIKPTLDRLFEELTPIELAVLRIAVYELKNRPEIPYRVVINEALELTKTFGTVEGYKYVNAILDKLSKTIRSQELLHR